MGKNLNPKKNAVLVGGTGNLGRVVARFLANEHYNIDSTWMRKDHPDATKIQSYNQLPFKIHLAIYLAGINIVERTEKITPEQWDEVMNVNLKGAFLFAKSTFASMKRARGSTFITISSIMATHPYPYRLPYAVSKSGLEALTRELAVEWGRYKISTHCIRLGHLSGFMKSTPPNPKLLEAVKLKTPSKRLISYDEVASYIVWLAKSGAKSVSGGVIDFDPAYVINRWPL